MTKDREIQHQVRKAVKDYVDQLISERRGPGKGMAVSSNDLMVAARSAAHQANKYDTNMLGQFVTTGIKVIHETPRKEISPSLRLHGSKLTYSPLKKKQTKTSGNKENNDERHWLTWRTSPTPSEATVKPPRAATPARPASTVRPVSRCRTATPAAPRIATPAPPTPAPPTPAPQTPAFSEASLPVHLVPSPEPETIYRDEEYEYTTSKSVRGSARPTTARSAPAPHNRPITPYTARAPTPAEFNPNYSDVMTSAQMIPTHYQSEANPAFVPALKAWVHSANDYERDIAYSLFQALGGKAPDPPSKAIRPRPKSAVAMYRSQRRAPTAGVQTTMSAWEAYRNAGCNGQELALSGHNVLQAPGQDYYRYGPNKGTKPRVTKKRIVFPPTEYTCETSHFLNSMQPFKRDFVINPEWASESQSAERKHLAFMMSMSGAQTKRY